MSLHASLKSASSLVRHRNVLSRAERLDQLKEEERWTEANGVYGLPKVGHRKAAVGGKAEKEETEEGATPAAAGATAAAPGAKGAAGAKPAAAAKPAAGAKGAGAAAPAAKAAAPAAKKK